DARAYRQSIGAQPILILAALIAVYIVLSVLCESLAHPLTIISTLPSASLGALLALQIFNAKLSLIAFVGRAAFTSLAAYRSQRSVGPIMTPAISCSTGVHSSFDPRDG